jgi:type VI secretion system secreted protein VgrG
MENITQIKGTTLNRYRLNIPACPYPLDVESFDGLEQMSVFYHYTIRFTCLHPDLTAEMMLSKSVTLTMGIGELFSPVVGKVVHGVVTHFRRVAGSRDQCRYEIILEPFISLLDKQFRTHRFFINKSVPEVVKLVLKEHGLHDWESEFQLKKNYPKREQINQYRESDLAFIERLLAEVGIFYWFTLQQDAMTEVINFGDCQSTFAFGKKVRVSSPSGMNDAGMASIWGLNVNNQVVAAGVTAADYNHRDANKILSSAPADVTNGEGEGITYGAVYHYLPRHLDTGSKFEPEAETANFYARLEHERFLSQQTLIGGKSTDVALSPAQVLDLTGTVLPQHLSKPLLVIRTGFSASRSDALQVTFSAVPYSETRCWRPAAKPRPVVSGTLMARVTSPKAGDPYAHLNQNGLYWVKFDADRDDKAKGYESMPVRLAKPYGGDTYGMHFPLIQGTEVAIAFHEGDPDRPYIAHALHDSRHPDHVTADNNTRNVIRTAGLNKLRMEDKRGEEHIKLSTEYGGKTQLNLGHNVDSKRVLRGEGAELRTDRHISLRGGAGVFISADKQPQAQGQMLEMSAALAQLKNALQLVTSLAESASTSGALDADMASQQQLNSVLDQLKGAGLLASAPAGIGLVTPKNIQLSAGNTLTATAGKNVDMTIFKRLTVAAGEAISLFAQKAGMKIFAARGMLDIQAQTDVMRLQSDKTMNINSVSADIVLNAAQGITLMSGGAYIKIKDGAVEIGAPGKIALKSEDIKWGGSGSLEQALSPATVSDPAYKFPVNGSFQVKDKEDGLPVPYINYRIETDSGEVIRGVTDENGFTQSHYGLDPKSIKLFFE